LPNVLLFGCDRGIVSRLREDSRWNIGLARHDSWTSSNAPDPLYWNLVVDDCCSDDVNQILTSEEAEPLGIQYFRVNAAYLGETERAHGITFMRLGQRPSRAPHKASEWVGCDLASRLGFSFDSPRGRRTLEFNPVSDRAQDLQDFVDRFEKDFDPGRILDGQPQFSWESEARRLVLFKDVYGDPVLGISSSGAIDWLLLPYIRDGDTRLEALVYLCYRTAPKLWPDVYSDSFHPRKVQALEQELSRMVAERRSQELELEGRIDSERRFYAPYVNLTVTGDDALKSLVGKVFQDVFGCGVKDLDDQIEQGERKTLDLRIESGDWSGMLEVRSSGNRNSQVRDVERLDENYELAAKRHGEAKSKILVFNGMYWRDADERRGYSTFGTDVVDEAKIRGIGLITTQQLLDAIEAYRNEEMTREQFIQALAQPGLFHEPWK